MQNTEAIMGAPAPMIKKTRHSTRDGLGELRFARCDAVLEEAAGGKELGVEQGGAGGTSD